MSLELIENEIKKLSSDKQEIEKRLDTIEQEKQNLVKNLLAIDGAIQASKYFFEKMSASPQETETSISEVIEETVEHTSNISETTQQF